MVRIRFVGDSVGCAWLGVAFRRGEWIDDHGLSAEDLARVKANPTFEVDDSEEIGAAAPAKAAPKAKAEAPDKGASAGAGGLKV